MIELTKSVGNKKSKDSSSYFSHANCCSLQRPITRREPKIGRNDPYPYGRAENLKNVAVSLHRDCTVLLSVPERGIS